MPKLNLSLTLIEITLGDCIRVVPPGNVSTSTNVLYCYCCRCCFVPQLDLSRHISRSSTLSCLWIAEGMTSSTRLSSVLDDWLRWDDDQHWHWHTVYCLWSWWLMMTTQNKRRNRTWTNMIFCFLSFWKKCVRFRWVNCLALVIRPLSFHAEYSVKSSAFSCRSAEFSLLFCVDLR